MIDLSYVGQRSNPPSLSPNPPLKRPGDNMQFESSASHFSSVISTAPSQHEAGESSIDMPADSVASSFTPAFLKTARHPLICIFHLAFKASALLTFMFGSLMFGGLTGDYVFSFVTTTLFLSMDFWTVKNVTGRLLVGMRWWNNVREDGTSEWMYEAHTDERVINLTDKTVFWTALYVWPLIWIVFFIVYLLRLQMEWMLLVLIGISLSGANLIGYWKCSKEAKTRIQEWATTTAFRSVLGRFF